MPRRDVRRLTPLEALVMQTVWDAGEVTVREVQERLYAVKPMAYNTVLTVMRILRDKGFLQSDRRGRADVYAPAVSREMMGRRSVREVLERFFSGSAAALVSQLIDSGNLSDAEIRRIRQEVDAKLQKRK